MNHFDEETRRIHAEVLSNPLVTAASAWLGGERDSNAALTGPPTYICVSVISAVPDKGPLYNFLLGLQSTLPIQVTINGSDVLTVQAAA